jgi:hypothetical protein
MSSPSACVRSGDRIDAIGDEFDAIAVEIGPMR